MYDRDARYAGETKYPLGKLAQLALDGIVSFSVVPLRIAAVVGLHRQRRRAARNPGGRGVPDRGRVRARHRVGDDRPACFSAGSSSSRSASSANTSDAPTRRPNAGRSTSWARAGTSMPPTDPIDRMKGDYRAVTLAVEDSHWWYRGRRRVVRAALRTLDLPRPARGLDAGCGGGGSLSELAALGPVTGLEPSPEAAAVARSREVGEVVEGVHGVPSVRGLVLRLRDIARRDRASGRRCGGPARASACRPPGRLPRGHRAGVPRALRASRRRERAPAAIPQAHAASTRRRRRDGRRVS